MAQAAWPAGQLVLFKLSRHLFAQEPFKSFVGVAQVLAHPAGTWRSTAALVRSVLVQ